MTIEGEFNTLNSAINNIKTEIRNKGKTVSDSDTVASLSGKIDTISNKNGDPYAKNILNEIVEGTIEFLYDEILLYVRSYCFCGCENLKKAQFKKLKKICRHAFDSCYNLKTLVLENNQIVYLENINAFKFTPFENNEGYIYVPDSLINSYKTHDKWKTFKECFKKLSEFSN